MQGRGFAERVEVVLSSCSLGGCDGVLVALQAYGSFVVNGLGCRV